MTRSLDRLLAICLLGRDHARMRQAEAERRCRELQERLAQLQQARPIDTDLALPFRHGAWLLHRQWSDRQRRQLLQELAGETARALELRRESGIADMRHKLVQRLRGPPHDTA